LVHNAGQPRINQKELEKAILDGWDTWSDYENLMHDGVDIHDWRGSKVHIESTHFPNPNMIEVSFKLVLSDASTNVLVDGKNLIFKGVVALPSFSMYFEKERNPEIFM